MYLIDFLFKRFGYYYFISSIFAFLLFIYFYFLSFYTLHDLSSSYMTAEKEAKLACDKCLKEVGLEENQYRVGHAKARNLPWVPLFLVHVDKYYFLRTYLAYS